MEWSCHTEFVAAGSYLCRGGCSHAVRPSKRLASSSFYFFFFLHPLRPLWTKFGNHADVRRWRQKSSQRMALRGNTTNTLRIVKKEARIPLSSRVGRGARSIVSTESRWVGQAWWVSRLLSFSSITTSFHNTCHVISLWKLPTEFVRCTTYVVHRTRYVQRTGNLWIHRLRFQLRSLSNLATSKYEVHM